MLDFDLIIQGGLVYDGRGRPPQPADVGVKDGRVVYIGELASAVARQRLDAHHLCVAPGFIDAHTHDESFLFGAGDPWAKLSQGVTLECIGLCGKSISPLHPKTAQQLKVYLGPALAGADPDFQWRHWGDFKARYSRERASLRQASFVGNGSLRLAVLGFERRAPAPQELAQMKRLLAEELDQGAVGLSLGLSYPPGVFAGLPELVALAQVAAEHGKPVTTHMRNESDRLVEAVQEMISVARQSGCAMIISHHKAAGRRNYGKIHQTVAMIEAARNEGVEVLFDVYPYTAGNTSVTALVPPWALDGGVEELLQRLNNPVDRARLRGEIEEDSRWENLPQAAGWEGITVASCPARPEWEGQTLDQMAAASGEEPVEGLFRLILATKGHCRVVIADMDQDDVEWLVRHPLSNIISDSTDVVGKPHPRLYGAFTRVLGKYVREKRSLKLEEAIYKMTAGPAQRLHLEGRGVLEPGAWADLVVFDADTVGDRATYAEPRQYSTGIVNVVVAGEVVVDHGKAATEVVVAPV